MITVSGHPQTPTFRGRDLRRRAASTARPELLPGVCCRSERPRTDDRDRFVGSPRWTRSLAGFRTPTRAGSTRTPGRVARQRHLGVGAPRAQPETTRESPPDRRDDRARRPARRITLLRDGELVRRARSPRRSHRAAARQRQADGAERPRAAGLDPAQTASPGSGTEPRAEQGQIDADRIAGNTACGAQPPAGRPRGDSREPRRGHEASCGLTSDSTRTPNPPRGGGHRA